MSVLTPKFSAELASNVYQIKDDLARRAFVANYKSVFNMDTSVMATGKTGAFVVVKKPHVMGLMASGTAEYENQVFVAFKGTASLYDALTDLNAGLRPSHTGCHVHQGFYYAFDSVFKELRQFTSGLKGVSSVHCVGHSLGGAIATLAADWIKSAGVAPQVNLYTFGSPRVGLDQFAKRCTTRLVVDNIYRVYHKTDPVPMVPTWPFVHVPSSDADYLLDSPVAVPPWKFHFMEHYIDSVKHKGDWDSIKSNRPKGYRQKVVEQWLESDGIVSFTARTLELLNAALLYVIEKAINATGIALTTAFSASFTLLDRMAMFMAEAAKVSVEVSSWVFHLIKKMAGLIGIKVKEGMNLTVEFIRIVFLKVHQKISEMIWRIGNTIG